MVARRLVRCYYAFARVLPGCYAVVRIYAFTMELCMATGYIIIT